MANGKDKKIKARSKNTKTTVNNSRRGRTVKYSITGAGGVTTKKRVKRKKSGKTRETKTVTQPGGDFTRTVTIKRPGKPTKTRTIYGEGGNPVAPTEGPETNNVPQSSINTISPNASFNRRTASKNRTYTPVKRRR